MNMPLLGLCCRLTPTKDLICFACSLHQGLQSFAPFPLGLTLHPMTAALLCCAASLLLQGRGNLPWKS